MTNPSGISRRMQQCIQHLQANDPEGALVNLFPAIDKTAKKRRPKDGVGKRIKSFLQDEEVLITAVGTGNVFKGCTFEGKAFHDVLYEFGRTPIAHEGELDPRLKFNNHGGLQISRDNWNLPVSFIAGMAFAVIIAPENQGEKTVDGLSVIVLGTRFLVNEIWGKPDAVRKYLCEKFRDPALFS